MDKLINVATINKIYIQPSHKDGDWVYHHDVYNKRVGFLWWRHIKHVDEEYWINGWDYSDHKYSIDKMKKAIKNYNFIKDKEVYVKASVKIIFSKKDVEYIYFDSDEEMRAWVNDFVSKYGENYIYI